MNYKVRRPIGKLKKTTFRTIGAQFSLRVRQNQQIVNILKKGFIWGSIGALILIVILIIMAFFISRKLPDVEALTSTTPKETTKIYSNDDVLLAELHEEENRIIVPMEQISPFVKNGVIAMEDTDFYKHQGFNIKAIFRAALVDMFHGGRAVQGASTITQQLARNVFLTKKKKIVRKISELLLAVQIEKHYTKEEIIEMYLNQVYWGHNAYGIEAAAQVYFGKSASEINLAECAMLVGLLRGPELYTPYRNWKSAQNRKNTVLKRLLLLKMINPAQFDAASKSRIDLIGLKKHRYFSPYFTSYVVKQLVDRYGQDKLTSSGMKVYTTLNYKMDEVAGKVIKDIMVECGMGVDAEGAKYPSLNVTQGAIMAMDPRNGYILTMQGGEDFAESEFNRCYQALRQPGSAFKPFTYLAALEKGFSPGTFLPDAPIVFQTVAGPYEPINFDKEYNGLIPLRKALERSINIIAIKLNDLVGPEASVSVARRCGITSPMMPILSFPLGANEVTMFEMVRSYGVFASGGTLVKPISILRIEDRNGVEIYKHKIEQEQVFEPRLINALVMMLRNVVLHGTATRASISRPVAGKTGTTTDYRDAWFVGFIPQLVTAAWVGNDDNTPMVEMTGGWMPAEMWRRFMTEAVAGLPAQEFPGSGGLNSAMVCWESGTLAREQCPKYRLSSEGKQVPRVTTELYWSGREPTEYCDIHDPDKPRQVTDVGEQSDKDMAGDFLGQ